jgi:hypothetical protein
MKQSNEVNWGNFPASSISFYIFRNFLVAVTASSRYFLGLDIHLALCLHFPVPVLFYLCIYGLFKDAITSSDYIASNDRMINGKLIEKDMEGKGRSLI